MVGWPFVFILILVVTDVYRTPKLMVSGQFISTTTQKPEAFVSTKGGESNDTHIDGLSQDQMQDSFGSNQRYSRKQSRHRQRYSSSPHKRRLTKSRQNGLLFPPRQSHTTQLYPPNHPKSKWVQVGSNKENIYLWFDRFFGMYSSQWVQQILVQDKYYDYVVTVNKKDGVGVGNSTTFDCIGEKEPLLLGNYNPNSSTADSTEKPFDKGANKERVNKSSEERSTSPDFFDFPESISMSNGTNNTVTADPPLATKSFALYLTAFGCWGSEVFHEFLYTFKSGRFPAKNTTLDAIRSDSWLINIIQERRKQSQKVEKHDVPTVFSAWKAIRSLNLEETCSLRMGKKELPLGAGIFIIFIQKKGCSPNVLQLYKSYSMALDEEINRVREKRLRFPPRYFLVKAEVILLEQFY